MKATDSNVILATECSKPLAMKARQAESKTAALAGPPLA